MITRIISFACLTMPLCLSAQHEVHEFHDPIVVEGHMPERGPKGEPGPKGGTDGGKTGSQAGKTPAAPAQPTTSVQVGPGKVTVSQKAANQLIALLQEYYGTDFWSSLFSPSNLPTHGMETQMIDRIKALEGEAALDNRPADAKFFNDAANDFQNKSNVQMQINTPTAGTNGNTSIEAPLVFHNVGVRTPAGVVAGMVFTIPGFMVNANGKNAELLVRFYAPNGQPLLAHPNEPFYKDRGGLVVTGTGLLPVVNKFVNLSSKSFQIPYYALNLPPTNGFRKYEIKARASLYLNGVEVFVSPETTMLVTY